MTKDAKGPVLEITRVFDAPPARIFEAWLDRDEWASWIGPEGVECDVPLLEPRVNGRYRLTMHLEDGKILPIAGVFTAIEANKSFSFTWGPEGDPSRQSLVTVDLRDLNGRTELTLRQEGLPTTSDRDAHDKGWNSALNKLAAHLALQTNGVG
jgi:uncharacterized protein YndB with AHSA1/START domain